MLDIETSCAKALAWLERGLEHVSQSQGESEIEPRRLKVLAELGLLTSLAPPDTRCLPFCRAVLDLVEAAGSGGRFLCALWHQPNQANRYLLMLYGLARDGRLDRAELADLRRLLEHLCDFGSERLPFRSMDFLFSKYLLTGKSSFEQMDALSQFGCLKPGASLAACDDADKYAITHTIFYMTGFGTQIWPVDSTHREDVLLILKAMRFKAELEENWDIYSELLSCEIMVGCDEMSKAVDRLMASQHPDGHWTGPLDFDEELREEGVIDPCQIDFYSNYHTTLVAWMALRLHRSPDFFQPFEAATFPFKERVAGTTYRTIPPAWRNLSLSFLSLAEKAESTPPDSALLADPQGVLPYFEWQYWCGQLEKGHGSGPLELEIEVEMKAAGQEGSWRRLRCLLLMAPAEDLRDAAMIGLGDAVLAALRSTPLSTAGDPHSVDLLVCAGLLGAGGAELSGIANNHLMLSLLRRNIFAVAPIATFLRAWLDPSVLRSAESFVQNAYAHSVSYGFIFEPDAAELRRSLSAETYLNQIGLAKLRDAKLSRASPCCPAVAPHAEAAG